MVPRLVNGFIYLLDIAIKLECLEELEKDDCLLTGK